MNPAIHGLKVFQKEFKLSLFADDLVLYLTDPVSSLISVNSEFKSFFSVSGLNINYSKTINYPVNLPDAMVNDISNLHSYTWTKTFWPYLGVKIPLDLADIEKINFVDLATQTLSQLKQWHTLGFSWWDKLSLVKSFLLPKFLYLFRTLPIFLPSNQLRKWQRIFDQFVWDY